MTTLYEHRISPTDPPAPWVGKYGLLQPYGKCQCGCGEDAPIASDNDTKRGCLVGEPQRYLFNHHRRMAQTPHEKFCLFQLVGEADSCWEWPHLGRGGYGYLCHNDKGYCAHRLSYEYHIGPIPEGLFVCHRCDNRACTNPAHLWLGTGTENTADRDAKGRQAKGERNGNVKLASDDVREVRALYGQGWTFTQLATAFGVSRTQITRIISRKLWAHVP